MDGRQRNHPPLMPIRVSMYDGRSCITDDKLKTGVYSGMTRSRTGMMYSPGRRRLVAGWGLSIVRQIVDGLGGAYAPRGRRARGDEGSQDVRRSDAAGAFIITPVKNPGRLSPGASSVWPCGWCGFRAGPSAASPSGVGSGSTCGSFHPV